MRIWERALGVCAALALSSSCGAPDGSGGDGPRNVMTGTAGMPATGGRGANTSGGSGGSDFGNNGGMPTMSFDDILADAGDGVNESDDPDDQKCGGVKIKPEIEMEVIPGNILLVFDKSGSMDQEWGSASGNSKWEDALTAIPAALDPLQDQITVGALFFPTDDDCGVNAPDQAPHIGLMEGPDFLTAWDAFAMANVANGATPLRFALDAADVLLQNELPDLIGITTVVIVTDGQPNCLNGQSRDDDSAPNLTPLIANWLTQDVKTYVVGLPGLDDLALSLLTELAVAGGTTDYIPADDPTTLQTELAKIVSESVTTNFDSCTIPLDEQPPSLDKLNVVVVKNGTENSVARDLGASGGWTVDAAGENIILQGTFCELAKMGEYDEITVVFGCTEAPPLEPPPPLI